MKRWKKWCIFSSMSLQLTLGLGGILWWWQSSVLTITISEFLGTKAGNLVLGIIASYLVLGALVGLGWSFRQPTTQKTLMLYRDHASKIQIDQKAVEHQLRLALGGYDLINTKVEVKLLKKNKSADVFIQGDLTKNANLAALEAMIRQTITTDLKEMLNIDLRRLNVSLQPYQSGQKVTII